eukprot:SAG22_NODE_7564_length_728_cov_1.205087_1_plen_125_part_01
MCSVLLLLLLLRNGGSRRWQNTRLTYWNMAAAADFDTLSTIMEFYLQTLDFNRARTLAYFNHSGIFYTETKTLFGAFAVGDYGANASTRHALAGPNRTLPAYLEQNGYIHYDCKTKFKFSAARTS